ncbi:hypothetical protein JW710_04520, partial [Candidatus Dojkabacteria bacterium]|nr:hypothetical protein [Candidatus Dojkabacteria bacterium]
STDIYGINANIMSDQRLYSSWNDATNDQLHGQLMANLTPPTFYQSAYRFFNNIDSTNVGTPLAAQDTAAVLGASGARFRIRMLIHTDGDGARRNYEYFKLQYVDKGSGTCSSPVGGTPATYTDVSGLTYMAYYDNPTPTDGTALTSNVNDPVHSGHTTVGQTYEEVNNFTNSQTKIRTNQDGMWDFSIEDNSAPGNSTYCFRIVKSDGTLLDSYSYYPEITTYGNLSVDIVDAGGGSISTPSVIMGPIALALNYQISTGTFGISTEKIRITNSTTNPQWTLNLSADLGSTSYWNGSSSDYDFNDPTANAEDGGDTDSIGGQMTIDPTSGTITPQSGCSTTGLSLGTEASFSEGTLDSITIISADNTADMNCFWDITGIGIDQTIPKEQQSDTYSIDMTLTIVAI